MNTACSQLLKEAQMHGSHAIKSHIKSSVKMKLNSEKLLFSASNNNARYHNDHAHPASTTMLE